MKIRNNALEVIMRDVLHGMSDFTLDSASGSQLDKLEIIAVDRAETRECKARRSADILPFPEPRKNTGK